MKKFLIITGPQGSGNHLFSRIFSQHKQVFGWEKLLETYWVPSDEEPFAKFWVNPELLTNNMFLTSEFYVGNVSCPFMYDGIRFVPKILEVCRVAKGFGVDVSIALVVRDKTINSYQQQRVRGTTTLPIAQEYYKILLDSEFPVYFFDHEALFLYGNDYLRYLSKILNFPIDYDLSSKFLSEDPNSKYIKYVENYWLDQQVWAGIQPFSNRNIT